MQSQVLARRVCGVSGERSPCRSHRRRTRRETRRRQSGMQRSVWRSTAGRRTRTSRSICGMLISTAWWLPMSRRRSSWGGRRRLQRRKNSSDNALVFVDVRNLLFRHHHFECELVLFYRCRCNCPKIVCILWVPLEPYAIGTCIIALSSSKNSDEWNEKNRARKRKITSEDKV